MKCEYCGIKISDKVVRNIVHINCCDCRILKEIYYNYYGSGSSEVKELNELANNLLRYHTKISNKTFIEIRTHIIKMENDYRKNIKQRQEEKKEKYFNNFKDLWKEKGVEF